MFIYSVYLSQNFLGSNELQSKHGKIILNILDRNYPNVLVYFVRAEKVQWMSSLINSDSSVAYPYLIYCNHIWIHDNPTSIDTYI